ncbi:hypothetical protein CPB84DRAFT_1777330 [Gymnopilus junonius]|uniref:Uncharacterized protein n=1 Tax=Gymnopilus junonius TaxID=109634 RepID=A0A9P5NRT3_GYMJU|nr:hypothetical protein CPB84DRAFT_1777330 [Gymnopilus junonius]
MSLPITICCQMQTHLMPFAGCATLCVLTVPNNVQHYSTIPGLFPLIFLVYTTIVSICSSIIE